MRTITLIRETKNGKAVRGTMSFQIADREGEWINKTCPTLENADFIIPAGTYPVEMTWSPKFKKVFPELKDVPEREGIRIHKGTLPEHSKGCILLDYVGMSHLTVMFNQLEKNDDEKEPAQIEIIDHVAA